MRKLMGHDNVKFFCSACRILKAGTNTAGHECLNKLLLEGDVLLASLADPMLFSLGSAIDLARVFARDRGGTATAYAHPAMLLKLMRAPDQRLRSKTIILFCHARRNRQWTERQMSDEESRIRANAVEGPWGVNSPAARAVMKEAWQDVDHRVVANALIGLHMLDGLAAVAGGAETMAANPGARFRAAAFAMGQMASHTLSHCFLSW